VKNEEEDKSLQNLSFFNRERCLSNCSLPTSKRWRGYVIIRNPGESQVAKKMNIKKPGKYALKVM